MKTSNILLKPKTVLKSSVEFETYTDTHTYTQIKEGLENRTPTQQDILNVVDDVASKYQIPHELIIAQYERLKKPSMGELVGDLSIDHILTSAVDPTILLLLFENFIPLLDGYSDEETKEIVRDYFFQLLDQTRAFLESYDEVYPKQSSPISLDMRTNISATALFLQTGSTCYDFYTFNSNLKNRNASSKTTSNSPGEPSHPHLYFSELVSFDSLNVSTSQQRAQKRILNHFLSLSSVRKKGITPCQELEPYVSKNVCRLDTKSNKLYSLRPTGYLLEVNSYRTIKECIKLRQDKKRKNKIQPLRPEQLNDILSLIVHPESVINTSIKDATTYQLTYNDLSQNHLEQYIRSAA